MAFRSGSARDEVLSSGNFTDTLKGIFRMGGGWGNVSGPGIFMLRVMITGTITGAGCGMFVCPLVVPYFGTASLPFLVSACCGFVVGAVGFYRDCLRKALLSLDHYPLLLRLHLHANYPSQGFDGWPAEQLRSVVFGRSWTLQSMLVSSWLTAAPALDRIMELEEDAIVTNELEKEAWRGRDARNLKVTYQGAGS